ncbi:methyl-accepting chemotaxis protein [Deinococcus petrolearius]|uniref:Methyl-accepting chemotaxis protein n=1 Tax=Deinococcus petrolearius TaxID=1751295 RepID=A0ABW1DKF4_9DEIO
MSQNARLDPTTAAPLLPGKTGAPARSPARVRTPRPPAGERSTLLGRLSVGQKLALAGLLLGVPFVLTNVAQLRGGQAQVRQLQTQLGGQQLLVPLLEVLQNTQQVQLSSVQVLQGETGAQAANTQQLQALEKAFKALSAAAAAQGLDSLAAEVKQTQQNLDTLRWSVESASVTAAEAQKAYSDVLQTSVTPLFTRVAVAKGLNVTADPRLAALFNLTTTTLPENMALAGSVVAGTSPVLERLGARGSVIDARNRADARVVWESAYQAATKITANLTAATALSPDLKSALGPAAQKLQASADDVFNGLNDGLIVPERLSITSAELAQLSPAYLGALYGTFKQSVGTLGNILNADVASRTRSLQLSTLLLVLGTLLVAGLLYLIARSITGPLGTLTSASRRLAAGDLQVDVPVTTRDEVGLLTTSFNTAAAQLRENALRVEQERLEAQKLQNNIGEFLDVTMDIAGGDLTRRGQVTEDVLGNVVDSINLMTDELAQVLQEVQQASQSVTGGSQAMLGTTAQIERGTRATVEEARRVSEQAAEVTQAIRAMAQNAQSSAQTAQQALLASQQGQEAVEGTLSGMQNIRREVQGVAKRIKGLGDRSLEIQDIVDTITQITRQTHLLALNASIEAAGAGEAGGRFSIVADEVRKLADTSAQATARIAALIKNVQAEIQDVIASVEDGTREVEQGYRVAGSAGERLRELGVLATQAAQFAELIADSTQSQVRAVEQMGGAVGQIATIAQDSQGSVSRGRAAAEQLEQLSQELGTSLARFRLPA